MHTQFPSPLFSRGLHDSSSSQGTFQTHRAHQIQLHAQASADLTVITDEGDTVTLSASSILQASHMTYDARGRVQGQRLTAHATSQEIAFADDVAFTVQGELNAAELADIRSLIGTIEELATDFFAGDFDLEELESFNLEDFDALAGVDATLSLTRHVSVAQVGATTSTRPQAETTPLPSKVGKRLGQVIDDLTQATQRLQAVSENISRRVPKLLDEILASLAERQQLDAPQRALVTRVAGDVTARLGTPESSTTEATATPHIPSTRAETPGDTEPPAVRQEELTPPPEAPESQGDPEAQRLLFTYTTLTQRLFQLPLGQT